MKRKRLPKKLKVRRSWGNLNPATRVIQSKKNYSRAATRRQARLDAERDFLDL